MSGDAGPVAIAAVLDAVTLLRGEMAAITRSNARIEAGHKELHQRLDTIEAAQAELANVAPFLQNHFGKTVEGNEALGMTLDAIATVVAALASDNEANHAEATAAREKILGHLTGATGGLREAIDAGVMPLTELIDTRLKANDAAAQEGIADVKRGLSGIAEVAEKIIRDGSSAREQAKADLKSTGTVIAFTRAAVLGDHAPLPVIVDDHPMLERYILHQRPDLTSSERALVEWRKVIAATSAEELIALLNKQQTPSPTDTPESRLLRYRLAAITRAKIEERGGVPPLRPTTTRATDRSAGTGYLRNQELAALWRQGESTELYAEPELAGALDIFDALDDKIAPSAPDAYQPELSALHSDLAKRIELGERPTLHESRPSAQPDRAPTIEPSKDR